MVEAAPHTAELDEFLKVMIQSVKSACNSAVPHLNDDPSLVEHAFKECEEMLNTVMEGEVEEWID